MTNVELMPKVDAKAAVDSLINDAVMFSESETCLIFSVEEARSKIDLRLNSFVSRLTRRYPNAAWQSMSLAPLATF